MMPKLLLLVLSATLMAPPVDSFAASSLGSHRAGAAKVSYYIGVCLMICMMCASVACHYYLLCVIPNSSLSMFKLDEKSLSSCHHPLWKSCDYKPPDRT